jgi:hypothetical protein
MKNGQNSKNSYLKNCKNFLSAKKRQNKPKKKKKYLVARFFFFSFFLFWSTVTEKDTTDIMQSKLPFSHFLTA